MRFVKSLAFLVAVLSGPLCVPATADTLQASVSAERPVLTVIAPSGKRQLGLPEIEKLGLRSVITRSPWEAGDLNVEGVLLRDLLRHVGLADAKSIVVVADDDYTQIIPREDWTDWPVLLVTRQDGKPLTRRTQGPTRLIYPISDHPELQSPVRDPRWVWTIKSIAAATQ